MPNRFLLFSLPRCGSTTLMHILACHPEISCLREPFNPDQCGRTYLDRVHDPRTLATTLGEIWAKHQGIKHVWHPSGWPFVNASFNLLMLDQPNVNVLFLNRRNELRRLISHEIAIQTRIWHRPHLVPDRELAALDPVSLRAKLDEARASVSICLGRLLDNGARFEQLWYEDFFDPDTPPADRLARADRLLQFLGYGPLTVGGARYRAVELLDPTRNRLNDETSYRRIPNIDEIDAICGNDAVGRVFVSEL
jgi:hypothetical protein